MRERDSQCCPDIDASTECVVGFGEAIDSVERRLEARYGLEPVTRAGLHAEVGSYPVMRESMMLTLEPITYNGQARSGVYLAETFVVTNAVPPARSA